MSKYKKCIVLGCNATSKLTSRSFFVFPKDEILYNQWKEAAGVYKKHSSTTQLYICDDHFNVKFVFLFLFFLWFNRCYF